MLVFVSYRHTANLLRGLGVLDGWPCVSFAGATPANTAKGQTSGAAPSVATANPRLLRAVANALIAFFLSFLTRKRSASSKSAPTPSFHANC